MRYATNARTICLALGAVLACGGGGQSAATAGASAQPAASAERAEPPASADRAEQVAALIHEEINRFRVSRGLRQLAWHGPLARVAATHSRDMVARSYFSHTTPDGVTVEQRYQRARIRCRAPIGDGSFRTSGENIHMSSLPDASVDEIARVAVQSWLRSPGHLRNLSMPEWTSQGIGVALTPSGEAYVTQKFC